MRSEIDPTLWLGIFFWICDRTKISEALSGKSRCLHGKLTQGNCVCEKFWRGQYCQLPDCQNGGIVITDEQEDAKCFCDKKLFFGRFCESSKCLNGQFENDRCICDNNYEGKYCDIEICENGGTPSKSGSRLCECNSEWSGDRCEICDGEGLTPRFGFCCSFCYTGEDCGILDPPEGATGCTPWFLEVYILPFLIVGVILILGLLFGYRDTIKSRVRNIFCRGNLNGEDTVEIASLYRNGLSDTASPNRTIANDEEAESSVTPDTPMLQN